MPRTPAPRTTRSRAARRVGLTLALGAATAVAAPVAPASAGGDCVDVGTYSGYGATVCTPWGG